MSPQHISAAMLPALLAKEGVIVPGSSRRLVRGPLGPFADGFAVHLVEQGYSRRSVLSHLQRIGHLSRWMAVEGLEVEQLTPSTVARFLAERRRLGYTVMVSSRGSGPLLGYLGGLGVLGVEEVVRTPAQVLLEDFRGYLLNERGLQASTASLYVNAARVFIAERSEPLGDDLARLSAVEISAFVLDWSRRGSVTTASNLVSALRGCSRLCTFEAISRARSFRRCRRWLGVAGCCRGGLTCSGSAAAR